jgi:hypothetical protein
MGTSVSPCAEAEAAAVSAAAALAADAKADEAALDHLVTPLWDGYRARAEAVGKACHILSATSSNACCTLISGLEMYPMTWQGLPYIICHAIQRMCEPSFLDLNCIL